MRLAVAGPRAAVVFQAAEHRAGTGQAAGDGAAALAVALADVGRALPGSVRVLLLRGDAWSLPLAQPRAPDLADSWQEGVGWLADRADLVSVAAVHGLVSGAGLALALACDLRVMSVDTTFSLPEAGLGQLPGPGVAGRLVELLGYPTAFELCLTGRRLTAAEATAAGMAQRAVPLADLDEAAENLVTALLAVTRDVAAETKALLRGAAGRPRRDQLAAERAAFARLDAAHPAG